MSRRKKLDLLILIATIFNNSLLTASFVVGFLIVPVGTLCSLFIYFYIGAILAFVYREKQYVIPTLVFWLPAMCFDKVTRWISK